MLAKRACTVLLMLGIVVLGTACPRQEEPAPPPPPPPPVEPVAAQPAGNASIVLRDGGNGCELDWKTERSIGWLGRQHIWEIVNDCQAEAKVELVNFRPSDPFVPGAPRERLVPAGQHRPLHLTVRGRNQVDLGIYEYDVLVNGQEYDPEIDIRDPGF